MMDAEWLAERVGEDLWPLEGDAQVWARLTVRAPDGAYGVVALECPVVAWRLPDLVGWAGWGATRSAGEALSRLHGDLHGRYEAWPRRGVALSSPLAPSRLGVGATDEGWEAEDGFSLPDGLVARADEVEAAVGEVIDDAAIEEACELAEYVPRWSVACGLLLHGPDGTCYEVADGDLLATGARADGDRFVLDLEAPWELVAMPGSPLLSACRLAELGPLAVVGFGRPSGRPPVGKHPLL